jgi:hypothetical protein
MMGRTFRYRMTRVVTTDYGDGPAAGQRAIGHLARIPDGTAWDDFPQTIAIGVPLGTRPGQVFRITIATEGEGE